MAMMRGRVRNSPEHLDDRGDDYAERTSTRRHDVPAYPFLAQIEGPSNPVPTAIAFLRDSNDPLRLRRVARRQVRAARAMSRRQDAPVSGMTTCTTEASVDPHGEERAVFGARHSTTATPHPITVRAPSSRS